MRILLAEDDLNIAHITQICLEKIGGHQVVLCTDGQSAIDCALTTQKTQPFDLVILDGMMPKKGGVEVAKELRGSALTDVPIIFLSAKTDEKDISLFASLGQGYIAKPFNPQTICATIDSIMNCLPKSRPAAA